MPEKPWPPPLLPSLQATHGCHPPAAPHLHGRRLLIAPSLQPPPSPPISIATVVSRSFFPIAGCPSSHRLVLLLTTICRCPLPSIHHGHRLLPHHRPSTIRVARSSPSSPPPRSRPPPPSLHQSQPPISPSTSRPSFPPYRAALLLPARDAAPPWVPPQGPLPPSMPTAVLSKLSSPRSLTPHASSMAKARHCLLHRWPHLRLPPSHPWLPPVCCLFPSPFLLSITTISTFGLLLSSSAHCSKPQAIRLPYIFFSRTDHRCSSPPCCRLCHHPIFLPWFETHPTMKMTPCGKRSPRAQESQYNFKDLWHLHPSHPK